MIRNRVAGKFVGSAVSTAAVAVGLVSLSSAPAIANGHAEFSPSGPLAFGSQFVATPSATQTETITNLADGDGNFLAFAAGSVTVTGADAADFAISSDSCSGATLLAHGTCAVAVTFTPSATGARNAILHFVFTGGGNVDPASPQDVALSGTGTSPAVQLPVNGCVTAPKALPVRGTSRLMKRGCVTNAGTAVTVRATGSLRGDIRLYRIFKRANGSTYIRTYGSRAKIRVTWSAPSVAGFALYEKSKTYRT